MSTDDQEFLWPLAAIDLRITPEEVADDALVLDVALWDGPLDFILQVSTLVRLDRKIGAIALTDTSSHPPADFPMLECDCFDAARLIGYVSSVKGIMCRKAAAVRHGLTLIEQAGATIPHLDLVETTRWHPEGAGRTLFLLRSRPGHSPTLLPWGLSAYDLNGLSRAG